MSHWPLLDVTLWLLLNVTLWPLLNVTLATAQSCPKPQEITEFQKEKQRALNQIDVIVNLKMHQVRGVCVWGGI